MIKLFALFAIAVALSLKKGGLDHESRSRLRRDDLRKPR